MRKNFQNIIMILVILVFSITLNINCQQGSSSSSSDDDNDDPSNGTITINLINAVGVADGTNCYIRIFNDGGNPSVDTALEELDTTVNSESFSVTSTNVYLAAINYDIWMFIDLNNNAVAGSEEPDTGDKYNNPAYDESIDGNKTVIIDYDDLLTH